MDLNKQLRRRLCARLLFRGSAVAAGRFGQPGKRLSGTIRGALGPRPRYLYFPPCPNSWTVRLLFYLFQSFRLVRKAHLSRLRSENVSTIPGSFRSGHFPLSVTLVLRLLLLEASGTVGRESTRDSMVRLLSNPLYASSGRPELSQQMKVSRRNKHCCSPLPFVFTSDGR